MERHLASVDIGTHTARLLVARIPAPPELFRPLARKRTYIRLTGDMDPAGPKFISEATMDRAVTAIEGLVDAARSLGAEEVYAIATGVIREAANRERFLDRIQGATGLKVRTVSGEEEALLTGRGVLHGLGRPQGPYVVFDLGGGSTEFLFGDHRPVTVASVPLGAAVLTKAFLRADPPRAQEMAALSRHVDEVIREACPPSNVGAAPPLVVGTGGTAVTLAAMVHGLAGTTLTAEKVNGLETEGRELSSLFERMMSMRLEDRRALPGLDPERADVILAGTLVVLRILKHFHAPRLTVSMSDLLEGIIISVLEETENGGRGDFLRLYV